MKKSLMIILVLVLSLSMLFAGCSASRNESSATADDYYAEEAEMQAAEVQPAEAPRVDMEMEEEYGEDGYAEKDYDEAASDSVSGSNLGMDDASSILEPSVDRKIIYSGYIAARTKNFEEDYKNILDKVSEAGGYVENANIYGTEPEEWQDEGRHAEITIRVPSDKFDSFIEMLDGIGETTNSSVSGQDISLQYFDTETRLETLRIREDRLQELLEKAASLEDIIDLERELANVSYEIQSYEVQLRNYDSLIDFSTITVSLQEVQEQAEIAPSTQTLGERISNAFYSVINGLTVFFRGFLVVFIAALPIIVILAVILAIVLISVKAGKKRRAAKKLKQEKNNNQE